MLTGAWALSPPNVHEASVTRRCDALCLYRSLKLSVPLQLPNVGVQQKHISFTNVTMESDKYIVVRETDPTNTVVIIDMASPLTPLKRPIAADSALMNPNSKIIALKAANPGGAAGDSLQIFNLDAKQKIKSVQFPEQVVFWKWITGSTLGLITSTAVYHWDMNVRYPNHLLIVTSSAARVLRYAQGAGDPGKIFDRTTNLEGTQIINYRVDPDEKWCVLVGIAPGAPERCGLAAPDCAAVWCGTRLWPVSISSCCLGILVLAHITS